MDLKNLIRILQGIAFWFGIAAIVFLIILILLNFLKVL